MVRRKDWRCCTSFLGSAVLSLLLTTGSSLGKIGPWLALLRPVTGLGEQTQHSTNLDQVISTITSQMIYHPGASLSKQ